MGASCSLNHAFPLVQKGAGQGAGWLQATRETSASWQLPCAPGTDSLGAWDQMAARPVNPTLQAGHLVRAGVTPQGISSPLEVKGGPLGASAVFAGHCAVLEPPKPFWDPAESCRLLTCRVRAEACGGVGGAARERAACR